MDSILVKCDKCVELYLFQRWNTKKQNQLVSLDRPTGPRDDDVPDIESESPAQQDSMPELPSIDEEANVPDFSHENVFPEMPGNRPVINAI